MDTGTVLEIIEMLEARIDTIKLNQPAPILSDWHNGLVHGLEGFKDHLQKHIHSLQNAVENQTGE